MNNDEFKFGIKLTITITLIILGIIIGISIFVFTERKTEKDIYSEILSNTDKNTNIVDISEISLETKGINKEEFESYLRLFGYLVREYPELVEKEEKNTLMIDAAVILLNTLYTYNNEVDGIATFEADKINQIVKEMNGAYIDKKLDVKNVYKYDEEKNIYIPQIMEFPNCLYLETININKEYDKIEAEFKVAFPNENDSLSYTNSEPVDLETYTVKAVILENTEYEYSKYYVSSIEVISKEMVSYNK